MANMRISGIMSGFDTDTMIKDLMKAESAKLDKVKKDKQYATWQQEGFRDIINKIKMFQSNYFDVLKSGQNLTSATSFAKFSYSVKSGGVDSDKVSIIAGADVKNKSVTINSIDQLASKDRWTGNVADLSGIKIQGLDAGALSTSLGTAGKNLEFTLAVGSTAKVINIDPTSFSDVTTLQAAIQSKVTAAFGSDYGDLVTTDGTDIKFDVAGSEVKIMKYGTNSESMVGLFGADVTQSSKSYQTKSIGELFGLDNTTLSSIKINDTTIVLDATDTISKMVEKINASEAGVTVSYDSLGDKFSMVSKTEGSANNIKIQDGSNAETLFGKLFGVSDLVDANSEPIIESAPGISNGLTYDAGVNAKLTINNVSIIQGNNNFSLDGINYSLKATSTDPIEIGVETDTTSIIDNIKGFVKDYNEIVDYINGKLTEKRDYDYAPLTDDEKEALTEEEITKWEEKAKAGMLKGSSELSTILTQFRNAVIEPTTGVGMTMNQIGISSTSYTDRGKLTIDETKLKAAIESNYDEVVNLFTKESTTTYNDSANRPTRDKENGVASRFEDIIKDYVRTTRDTNGNKGILIVKAGMINDASQFSNTIQKTLTAYDERLSDLADYLANKEEYYYTMFSKMESALSQMDSQASALMSQLGSN